MATAPHDIDVPPDLDIIQCRCQEGNKRPCGDFAADESGLCDHCKGGHPLELYIEKWENNHWHTTRLYWLSSHDSITVRAGDGEQILLKIKGARAR